MLDPGIEHGVLSASEEAIMATPSFGSGPAIAQAEEEESEHEGPTAAPDRAEIETRAYFIYLEEGGGDPADHWERAERELAGKSGE
jgi:hypothetical protein